LTAPVRSGRRKGGQTVQVFIHDASKTYRQSLIATQLPDAVAENFNNTTTNITGPNESNKNFLHVRSFHVPEQA